MSMLMEPFAPWQRDVYRHLARAAPTGFFPPADILVTDEDVTVHLDVPGMRPEDLEIEMENDILTIRGERRFPYAEQDPSRTTWRRIERPFGAFERSLRVPRGLDPNAIEAALHDGVLTLRMRKPEPLKPHRIEVRMEEPAMAGQSVPVGTGEGQQAGQPAGAAQPGMGEPGPTRPAGQATPGQPGMGESGAGGQPGQAGPTQ